MKASLVAVIVGSLLAGTDSASIVQNVALRGQASQSSILVGYAVFGMALNAIDGNPDSVFWHGSCAQTHKDIYPWWRVDLMRPHIIHSILITARKVYYPHLSGAGILVGNSLENQGKHNPRCGTISGIGSGETRTFICYEMVGRYVTVFIPRKWEYLGLCEVQVFAVPAPPMA